MVYTLVMGRRRRSHLVIPDTQIFRGVPLRHIDTIGKLAAELRPWVIVIIGDWWDLPSLSSYDEGKLSGEARRLQEDIDAGNSALDRLMSYIKPRNSRPRLIFCVGNHEQRLMRYVEANPKLSGVVSYDLFNLKHHGWEVHDFLDPVEAHGILYSHYFPRSASGRIVQSKRGAPSAIHQVKREMQSCTSGHLQGLDYSMIATGKHRYHGLMAGSCYLHKTGYIPTGGENYWRGIVVKENVDHGDYDFRPIRLSSLVR